MIYLTHSPKFKKRFNQLSDKLKDKVTERLNIFVKNEYHDILNNHPLHGEYFGCRSINITGDIRVVYRKVEKDNCRLLTLGTHSQLYE